MSSCNAILRQKIQNRFLEEFGKRVKAIFYLFRTDFGADVYGCNGSNNTMIGIALVGDHLLGDDEIEVIH